MRKPERKSLPLSAFEKKEVESARIAFAKALTDAGAAHVIPLLKVDFIKTVPLTESPAHYIVSIATADKCRLDTDEPEVAALFSALAQGRSHLNMRMVEEPLALEHEFSGSIDLHTPKVADILRNVRIPKL
jgi:hypothetical protein